MFIHFKGGGERKGIKMAENIPNVASSYVVSRMKPYVAFLYVTPLPSTNYLQRYIRCWSNLQTNKNVSKRSTTTGGLGDTLKERNEKIEEETSDRGSSAGSSLEAEAEAEDQESKSASDHAKHDASRDQYYKAIFCHT